jgi:hypothetical protein
VPIGWTRLYPFQQSQTGKFDQNRLGDERGIKKHRRTDSSNRFPALAVRIHLLAVAQSSIELDSAKSMGLGLILLHSKAHQA